jgi:hypothetical protein
LYLVFKEDNMKSRGQLVLGFILILLGVLFIAQKQSPAVAQWMDMYMEWPLNIVAAGVLMLIVGLLLGAPGMAVPAAVVIGVGGILYYQQMTGDEETWSYMWTLLPGSAGVGIMLAGLFSRDMPQARSGLNLIVLSAVLFVVFASYFGKLNLLLGAYGAYLPAILLVAVGLWLLLRGLLRNAKNDGSS